VVIGARTRGTILGLVAAALLAAEPALAAEPRCGTKDPQTGKIAIATLSFDEKESLTSLRLGRSTRDHKLILRYSIGGCALRGRPILHKTPNVPRGSDQLPDDAIDASHDRGRDELRVTLVVHPKKFHPGRYDAAVRLAGPQFQTTYTRIYVSRSTSAPWLPLSAAVVGALAALAVGIIVSAAKATDPISVDWLWLAIAIPVTLALGVWVLFSDYWGSGVEVWSGASDWAATARNAFGVGSAAVLVAIVAKVVGVSRKP
jgi:hypothetical protein